MERFNWLKEIFGGGIKVDSRPIHSQIDHNSPLVKALNLPKVDSLVYLWYWADHDKKDFDEGTSKVGLIVTIDAKEPMIQDTLSKGENAAAIFTPYSKVIEIIQNPKVTRVEYLNPQMVEILQSNQGEEVTLTAPWPGPLGDEWDSPAYDEFWHPIERGFQEKIDLLQKIGKKVRIVSQN